MTVSAPHLTADEELRYVQKVQHTLLDKWVPNFPPLCRTPKIGATAVAFFRRFYLSNGAMEFDPTTVAMACLWLASKTEGTQGFLHALPEIGTSPGVGEDTSIREMVPLLANGNDITGLKGRRHALIFEGAVPPGGFAIVSGGDAAAARETRDAVLEMELAVLEGIGFHLHCHHPHLPLRGLIEELCAGLGDLDSTVGLLGEGGRDGGGYELASSVRSKRRRDDDDEQQHHEDRSSIRGTHGTGKKAKIDLDGTAGTSLDAHGGNVDPEGSITLQSSSSSAHDTSDGSKILSAANEWVRVALRWDIPLLWSPSEIALAALLLYFDDRSSSPSEQEDAAASLAGHSSALSSREVLDLLRARVPSLGSSESSRPGHIAVLKAKLRQLAATKTPKIKGLTIKLQDCALWAVKKGDDQPSAMQERSTAEP